MSQNTKVDPDPFLIAGLAVNTISAICGIVALYRSAPKTIPEMKPGHKNIQIDQIEKLETHLGQFRLSFDRTLRIIDRGSDNSEIELYKSPIRVANSNIFMDSNSLNHFADSYAKATLEMTAILRWITAIQTTNPDLAYRIGKNMNENLSEVIDRINTAISEGGEIRHVIVELKSTLSALERALTLEIKSN